MKEKFEFSCKHCNEKFYTTSLKNLKIEKPDLGINEDVDLEECFKTNSFTRVVDTTHGQATLNIGDLDFEVKCPKCKHKKSYTVSEIHPTEIFLE